MIKEIPKQNYYPSDLPPPPQHTHTHTHTHTHISFKELISTDNGLLANMHTSPYASICWLIASSKPDNSLLWGGFVFWQSQTHLFNDLWNSGNLYSWANRKNFYVSQVCYETVANAEQWTVTSFLLSGRCKQAWMVKVQYHTLVWAYGPTHVVISLTGNECWEIVIIVLVITHISTSTRLVLGPELF